MRTRIILIGTVILILTTVILINLYNYGSFSEDESIGFIDHKSIKSISDLNKIESLKDKTILVNLWTSDSDDCLYLNEERKGRLINCELLHVFNYQDFRSKIEYNKFIKKKGIRGEYLLLPLKDYVEFVKEISLSQKRVTESYPIQCVVSEGEIIDINEMNKKNLDTFRRK